MYLKLDEATRSYVCFIYMRENDRSVWLSICVEGDLSNMKYFFWIAFAVFLAASIPHVAYFFASFEPSQGPEGIWWWGVSYAIAISIDVTVYLLSWTAFQRYRRYRTTRAVWQHWVLIVMCTVFSWAVNWAYARQFHNATMLNAAESVAPWLVNVFPFMASAFPLLGIVYTMMAETVSETDAEEKGRGTPQLTALTELARQTNLPLATLRQALTTTPARFNTAALLSQASHNGAEPAHAVAEKTAPAPERRESQRAPRERPITGQVVAIAPETVSPTGPAPVPPIGEGHPDKLQLTIEILRSTPDISDELLAERLSLKRPASALFWRRKASEILSAQEPADRAPTPRKAETWATTAKMNGKH